jgi:hypothetical protein
MKRKLAVTIVPFAAKILSSTQKQRRSNMLSFLGLLMLPVLAIIVAIELGNLFRIDLLFYFGFLAVMKFWYWFPVWFLISLGYSLWF